MRIEFSRYVERDLEEIADWIAQDNPRRAVSFIGEIREAFQRIGSGPLQYQLRPDIGEDARVAVVGNYVVLFWTDGKTIRIERVIFGGRDLPTLFQ
jgi:toxin ParE1/3/4